MVLNNFDFNADAVQGLLTTLSERIGKVSDPLLKVDLESVLTALKDYIINSKKGENDYPATIDFSI